MSHETKTTSNKPAFYAYTVQDRGEAKDAVWTRIGAAFKHKDGEGFNIVLNALPVDGKITLRTPREEAPEAKQS